MADIKQQQELAAELSSKLWAMANDLRGNMEAYEFKNYILGLLFYKELSDRTEKFVAEILKEDNVTFETAWKDAEYKEAIIDEMLIKLGYVLEPKYLFPYMLDLIRKDEFTIDYFEEAINSIIASTQGQDSENDFDGLFEDMDLKSSKLGKEIKQRSKLIGKVLQTIESIEVDLGNTDVDVLGTAYVTLIGLFAQTAGKKGGEFYTPTNISKLVARLATVGLTKVLNVADCACGSGSLLLQVGKYVDVSKYYGQEFTSSTYNLARMNMILHGIDYKNFSIINVDTLEDDTIFGDEKYAIQVANPPYSTKWPAAAQFMDDDRFAPYGKPVPTTKAELAFVQHMVYHMANGDSRIAVLLPHGVLARGGSEETIRKYLIKDLNLIDAIIGLPVNCFQGATIPVCCMVLKKERNGNSNNICFIDASKEFETGKSMNYLTEENIEKILAAYTERKDIDKFCHIATTAEIEENNHNRNIPRYVDTIEAEEIIDLKKVRDTILESQKMKEDTLTEILSVMKELGIDENMDCELSEGEKIRFKKKDGTEFEPWKEELLSDIFYRVNERNDGTFDKTKWISVARMYYQDPDKVTSNNIDTRTYVMREGDIAFEGHPNADFKYGRFVVNDIGAGVISELFPIYRHKKEYVLKYWKYAIQIEKIMAPIYRKAITESGASSNKLDERDFLKQKLEVPCLEEQERIADFLTSLDTLIEQAESELESYKQLKKALLQRLF